MDHLSDSSPITAPRNTPSRVLLRLLATTDVHMHLTGFDHRNARDRTDIGLARVASLIDSARSELRDALCLTFDNGDFLQGSPMADVMVSPDTIQGNPLSQALNTIGYDAIGLGNHDFDYGLDTLKACVNAIEAPVLCANFHGAGLPGVQSEVVLTRDVRDQSGHSHLLRIGVVSVLPSQTGIWNARHFSDAVTFEDPVSSLRAAVARLKAQQADVIIALAHTGIEAELDQELPENFALSASAVEGIDAMICGHTHRRFPGPDHAAVAGTNMARGTLNGLPVVMPGFAGSDLGVIDLKLERGPEGWDVVEAGAALRPVGANTPAHPVVLQGAAKAHDLTEAHLTTVIGSTDVRLHSYFSLVQPNLGQQLLAQTKIDTIRAHAVGTQWDGLPILGAAAPSACGGRAGPLNYLDMPAGPITNRQIATLCPFENDVWAVHLSGAQVLEWLERSMTVFSDLVPDAQDQALIDPMAPSFNFDALFGLQTIVDPMQPRRYAPDGRLIDPSARRVVTATWQGRPVSPDQRFLVATTSYRASGGGHFPDVNMSTVALRTETPMRAALRRTITSGDARPLQSDTWTFLKDLDVRATLDTAPAAARHFADIAGFDPQIIGTTDAGFLRVRLHL